MEVIKIILSVIYILLAAALVIVVLLQESKDSGLSGSIGGGSVDTFFGQNKGRTADALKKKLTAYGAGAFIILSLILSYLVLKK